MVSYKARRKINPKNSKSFKKKYGSRVTKKKLKTKKTKQFGKGNPKLKSNINYNYIAKEYGYPITPLKVEKYLEERKDSRKNQMRSKLIDKPEKQINNSNKEVQEIRNQDKITIQIITSEDNLKTVDLKVNKSDNIYKSIYEFILGKEFSPNLSIIYFNEEPLEKDLTFNELGIEESARFYIQLKKRASLDEIIQDIININPDLKEEYEEDSSGEEGDKFPDFVRNVPRTIKNKPWHITNDLILHIWRPYTIHYLPESFGDLIIDGDLGLAEANLASLPSSFGNLKVGGNLDLNNNKLTFLPDSFGNLKVGGNLGLFGNELKSLPDSFGNLKVGGDLDLEQNDLTYLPDSFGNLTVGGNLNLRYNGLTYLPDSFGNLTVGGNLNLHMNKLKSLPDNFGNLKVGGTLIISEWDGL